MPTRNGTSDPLNGIFKVLGELEADVRTIKHSQNNAAMKLDAIGVIVIQVEELSTAKADHERRLHKLEDADQRRKGAVGLLEWFARHWPFSIIVVGLIGFWTWLHGGHP